LKIKKERKKERKKIKEKRRMERNEEEERMGVSQKKLASQSGFLLCAGLFVCLALILLYIQYDRAAYPLQQVFTNCTVVARKDKACIIWNYQQGFGTHNRGNTTCGSITLRVAELHDASICNGTRATNTSVLVNPPNGLTASEFYPIGSEVECWVASATCDVVGLEPWDPLSSVTTYGLLASLSLYLALGLILCLMVVSCWLSKSGQKQYDIERVSLKSSA